MARIDAPLPLDSPVSVTFVNQIVFDAPQFIQFMKHSKKPVLACQSRRYDQALITNIWPTSARRENPRESDWQVLSPEKICTSCLPRWRSSTSTKPIPGTNLARQHQKMLWLELLHPFTIVKNLYLFEEFALCIVPALQELESRST
jgi:hypothetical protein